MNKDNQLTLSSRALALCRKLLTPRAISIAHALCCVAIFGMLLCPAYAQTNDFIKKPAEAMMKMLQVAGLSIVAIFLILAAIHMLKGVAGAREEFVLLCIAAALIFYAPDIADVLSK
ncbi:MAG: TrbC/VirB2 family protein [Acidobacteriota bacterium]